MLINFSLYNINNNILNNYEKNTKNRNYILLLNLNNINKYIENELNKIKVKYNYGYNLDQILNVYNEIVNNKNNEIEIIYKSKEKERVKIFGVDFVKNNKEKCRIIFNNEEYKLTEYFNSIDNELKIKLKGINYVTNMGRMFQECDSLYSLPDISKLKTSSATDMSCMFDGCSS